MKVQTRPLMSPEMQQMKPYEGDWLQIWLSMFCSVSTIPNPFVLPFRLSMAQGTALPVESAGVRFPSGASYARVLRSSGGTGVRS